MGLFSKLRKAATARNDDLATAVLTPSVMTMVADGSTSKSEIVQLANLCGFSPIYAGYSSEVLVALVESVQRDLSKGDYQSIINRAKHQMSMPMRETAIAFAIRIAMADGHVDQSEREALIVLSHNFDIDPDKLVVMFDVISMLQRAPQQVAA
ncbi:Tellurite resistance protein TerB [Falsiruegeria litorea R37]|uniref:Tellurite resistance protein TerB n=1 Tax=Falsiruegeria litorea R37 TaxID=1200284 RepID=A0A1Y5TEZ7_9RHOB|nr:tellurite resistance TerB family protein [Falsiruegeria litorea]SLN62583.1 Tellurite resistance protein TerB [Falsiruegeria litorea R37]